MPYLKLTDSRNSATLEFEVAEVRIGRAPDCEIVVRGDGAEVVSGYHLRFTSRDDEWVVEDLGSRNGSFLDEVPLPGRVPRPIKAGQVVGLGDRGPRFTVEASQQFKLEETLEEAQAVIRPSDPTMPMSAYAPTEKMAADAMPKPPAKAPPVKAPPAKAPPVKAPPPPPAAVSAKPPPVKVDSPRAAPPAAPPKAAREVTPPSSSPPQSAPPPSSSTPLAPPSPRAQPPMPKVDGISLVLVENRSGERWEGSGGRVRLGRGKECEIRPIGPSDTSVSRVHAEAVLKPDGRVVLRDAQSRNGTLLNGERVVGERDLKQGDRIQLGDQGPDLLVAVLETPRSREAEAKRRAPAPAERKKESAKAAAKVDRAIEKMGAPRRSFGGKGATVFFKQMFHETEQKSARRVRVVIWSAVAVLGLAVGGFYWWSERRVQEATAAIEARQEAVLAALADSITQAAGTEYERLRVQFADANAGSAPAAVVESLRVALIDAQQRTAALEQALVRAQASMAQQLAAGDSAQRAAQQDLQRLRGQLNSASVGSTSQGLLDSLRRAVRDAEQRATEINSQLAAVRKVDLPALAQANQGAVGLVTAYVGGSVFDGTGFVISRTGFLVTNRHVVVQKGVRADSVHVTLADQRTPMRSTIVMVAPGDGPDLAMIQINQYSGPYIPKVDWTGRNARQGSSAALIGFPAGLGNALDETQTVRTLMSAGILARVTPDNINFDGFTTGGSSGSPIFNAEGEVVAVHRAGLATATGLGFAVPITKLIPLMPPAARTELGLR